MKVIRKKRLDYIRRTLSQKLPHTSIISHRVIWYSASLLLYGWFLSWIAYDIFVWHKLITQVSITNYVGAITAMALIWAGTKLFKTPKHVAQSPQPQTPEPENLKEPEKEKQHKKRKRQPQPNPNQYPNNNHKHHPNRNHNPNTQHSAFQDAITTSGTYTNPETPNKSPTNASYAHNYSNASPQQTNNHKHHPHNPRTK